MTDAGVSKAVPSTLPRPARRRWQWNLKTLLLLMTVVAVWTTRARLVHETRNMRIEIEAMRRAAFYPIVSDPNLFAISKKPEMSLDEVRWVIYLPESAAYQLKFATRGIPGESGYPVPSHTIELLPGYHEVVYTCENFGQVFKVAVDGRPAIVVEESDDWREPPGVKTGTWSYGSHANGGSISGGGYQTPLSDPLELVRGIVSPELQSVPRNGELIWIESSKIATRSGGTP